MKNKVISKAANDLERDAKSQLKPQNLAKEGNGRMRSPMRYIHPDKEKMTRTNKPEPGEV